MGRILCYKNKHIFEFYTSDAEGLAAVHLSHVQIDIFYHIGIDLFQQTIGITRFCKGPAEQVALPQLKKRQLFSLWQGQQRHHAVSHLVRIAKAENSALLKMCDISCAVERWT